MNSKLDAQSKRLEEYVGQELKGIRDEMAKLAKRMKSLESELRESQGKIEAACNSIQGLKGSLIELSLQVVDLENRNRRDNIRIRGLPDSVSQDDLIPTVTKIFNQYLNRAEDEPIKMDRVHRVPPHRSSQGVRQRDVLCRIHHYPLKEEIMKAAWAKGSTTWQGSQVILLQDLSGKTLGMRRIVRPILDIARQKGADYRWGFPFHLTFRLDGRSFTLRTYDQLPDVFKFLGSPPVQVEDWYSLLVNKS